MEIGNQLFGFSRGKYEVERNLVASNEWQNILQKTNSDLYGYTENEFFRNSRGGFENDIFSICPYWWGDEENILETQKPNFIYKPSGFEIMWYKYSFRDSYMSENFTIKEIGKIFAKCIKSIK